MGHSPDLHLEEQARILENMWHDKEPGLNLRLSKMPSYACRGFQNSMQDPNDLYNPVSCTKFPTDVADCQEITTWKFDFAERGKSALLAGACKGIPT